MSSTSTAPSSIPRLARVRSSCSSLARAPRLLRALPIAIAVPRSISTPARAQGPSPSSGRAAILGG
eukprot:15481554-Alexandrium_andersonii.AAC.1